MTARDVDNMLDELSRQTARRNAAEATAWRAIDLLVQWCELLIEEPHTPADAHVANTDRLVSTTRMFLDTAPTYVAASLLSAPPVEAGEASAGGAG